MPGIANSVRNFLQATYTPLKPAQTGPGPVRVWEKWHFVSSLNPSPAELRQLSERLSAHGQISIEAGSDPVTDEEGEAADKGRANGSSIATALELLEGVIAKKDVEHPLRLLRVFRKIEANSLLAVAEAVIQMREQRLARVLESQDAALRQVNSGLGQTPPRRYQGEVRIAGSTQSAPIIAARKEQRELRQSRGAATLAPSSEANAAQMPLDAWLRLADSSQESDETLELVRDLALPAQSMKAEDLAPYARRYLAHLQSLLYNFGLSMQIEPVGFLHLERLSFTPAGIERGELLHSIPLAPGEEVNFTHKEWSNTSAEFEKIVSDYQEGFSEVGVTEKSELTESTNTQSEHSSALNTGVTASGEYGGVNFSASVGYNAADSASKSVQVSQRHSSETTNKASSRMKKEHKVSFKVASAAGTADEAVRKIANPFPDRATRVDYYQLVRKWKVDLSRYGIRLTYDLAISEPGLDIISKLREITEINDRLGQDFQFALTPDQITRQNYTTYAAQYAATVEPPPLDPHPDVFVAQAVTGLNRTAGTLTLDVKVDDGYEISKVHCDLSGAGAVNSRHKEILGTHIDWNHGGPDVHEDLPEFVGRQGRFPVLLLYWDYDDLAVQLTCSLSLTQVAMPAWQSRAWNALKDAAEQQYNQARVLLKERLAQLTQQLDTDPLSLRKIEREEIMKGVLRWMFGPTFEFFPASVPTNLYDPSTHAVKDAQTWNTMLYQGEIIKFLHHAIEWENVLYFLYPYFWSSTQRWDLKKYLNHVDPMHQVFLKSGSARVVLTIRPGFEKDFVSLLDTGAYNPASQHYLPIAEEMENYAKTNYPGVPAANPVGTVRPLLFLRQRKAWADMQDIMQLLETYFQKNGAYPTTAQGIAALKPYVTPKIPKVPTQDPWGNKYVYVSPGVHRDFDLVSHGADGKPGGSIEIEDADIASWAEASLVASWYEYTPTSAMDIAFDDNLPHA